MAVDPMAAPVITPVAEPITATDGLLLTHVPPLKESVIVTEDPAHNANGPLMAGGIGLTVTVAVTKHPVTPLTYEIRAVPAAMPETMPEAELTDALTAYVLQVPPGEASESIVAEPSHTMA